MAYEDVAGFFVQDNPNANPAVIGALPPRLGLLDDSPDRWKTFKAKITALNAEGKGSSVYKVVYLGRHGQGFHNVAEVKYGTEAWDDYWSRLNGDGDIIWGPDPLLTPLGITQAQEANAAWVKESPFGIPTPEKCFSSPLKRALDTWKETFACEGEKEKEKEVLEEGRKKVLILENCREEYGIHTCDKRSTKSSLRSTYPPPVYTFEDGFTEEDLIWAPDERETKDHIRERAKRVLDVIFSLEEAYVSITAHGGFINGFLQAIGRPMYSLPTGGVIPVVVKRTVDSNT